VAGGLSFNHVSGGSGHTCGQTTLNRVYCWGDNEFGQIGNGTHSRRLTPTAVVGRLKFTQGQRQHVGSEAFTGEWGGVEEVFGRWS
jgi:alpha-tubulin suppressor-like RCC1 family protein